MHFLFEGELFYRDFSMFFSNCEAYALELLENLK